MFGVEQQEEKQAPLFAVLFCLFGGILPSLKHRDAVALIRPFFAEEFETWNSEMPVGGFDRDEDEAGDERRLRVLDLMEASEAHGQRRCITGQVYLKHRDRVRVPVTQV